MDQSKATTEQLQLTTCMDMKLEIYNKRPASLKYRVWTRCLVTIEAIKCLPCFLRFTVKSLESEKDIISQKNSSTAEAAVATADANAAETFSVSINVPGITISLTTSRTKEYSYGLFWTHNRRNCFIYMAFDMEMLCRKHMKWLKKSIKNLEIYRQMLLVQRRYSRDTLLIESGNKATDDDVGDTFKMPEKQKDFSYVNVDWCTLDPSERPLTPLKTDFENSYKNISQRVSDIYEEINDGNTFSRLSIASGIYEEMKPYSLNFNAIDEEMLNEAPPLPPLPPPRRRVNTFENKTIDQINRFNSEPEADLMKKKTYRNLLNNLFGTVRSKRTVSESQAGKQLTKNQGRKFLFGSIFNGGGNLSPIPLQNLTANKRNSFSSPDLSKINFVDTFEEKKINERLCMPQSNGTDSDLSKFDISSFSLDESAIYLEEKPAISTKPISLESLNFSERLPTNFNLSACNTSAINLVGASGAVPSIQKFTSEKHLIEDDLAGYCIMAPIGQKVKNNRIAAATTTTTTTTNGPTSSSSGYSTGSSCSSTTSSNSSNTNSTELYKKNEGSLSGKLTTNPVKQINSGAKTLPKTYQLTTTSKYNNDRIYENLNTMPALPCDKLNEEPLEKNEKMMSFNKEFSDNLYENLLAMKAEQELQQFEEVRPAQACTSTPTDSDTTEKVKLLHPYDDGNAYQVPRRHHISIDDKLPSYYPNNTIKSVSPKEILKAKLWHSPTSSILKTDNENENITNVLHFKHLVNIKTKTDTVENLYISSPRKVAEQQRLTTPKEMDNQYHKFINESSAVSTTTTTATARKISGSVYEVNLHSKLNNNDLDEKLCERNANNSTQLHNNEGLEMAIWQKINFKFDDCTKGQMPLQIEIVSTVNNSSSAIDNQINPVVIDSKKTTSASPTVAESSAIIIKNGIEKFTAAENEYEQYYQASKEATRLLNKYASMTPKKPSNVKSPKHSTHKTQNPPDLLTPISQSKQINLSPISITSDTVGYKTPNSSRTMEALSGKKFSSLPRFRKFDLSPIKLKIHSVLQRHQNSQQQSQF